MKQFALLFLFIISGFGAAFYVSFHGLTDFSKDYDDEQEKLKDRIVIKVSHVVAENTPKGLAARKFKELVEKNTNGKVTVEIYPNGSLYNDINEWDALRNNNVQMIMPATAKVSEYISEFQVFDLPFAFNTYQEVENAFNGRIGEILMKKVDDKGMKGLGFWYNGFKQITNNKRPLMHPADFDKLHFRTMPSSVIHDQFKELGAASSVIPFNKTFENLQVGFVDGEENTISNIYTKKLYENQKYMTVSNHAYLGYAVIMNGSFWSGLPKDVQAEVEAAMDQTTDWVRRHSIELNDQQMRELRRNKNIQIHTLVKSERQQWKKALQPLYSKYQDDIGGDIMSQLPEW